MRSRRATWMTRNLLVLTAVSFTQDAASELLYPLLPVLLTGVLAAPPVVLGVIEGLADATAGLSKYVAGRWSDRRGRRRFIAAGYTLAAVGKAVVAAAFAWPLVLVGRVIDRFGKGVRSAPRDALLAEGVPREALGRAFGFHRAGDTAGAVVGPLLGLWALSAMGGDVRAALWWAVVPAVLSAALVAFVRDQRVTVESTPATPAATAATGLLDGASTSDVTVDAPAGDAAAVDVVAGDPVAGDATSASVVRSGDGVSAPLPRGFRVVVAMLVAIALVNFSDVLVLLRVSSLGLSVREVVLAYVVFNVVYTLLSYPAGALSDRVPRHVVYALGLVAFGVAYVGLGVVGAAGSAGGHAVVYGLVAVYGVFPALTDGVGKAWIASIVPRPQLGRAQGVYQACTSGAVLVAGLWAGLLWHVGAGDGAVPLVISGVVAWVAAVALVLGVRRVVARAD